MLMVWGSTMFLWHCGNIEFTVVSGMGAKCPNNCGEKWAKEWGSEVVTILESKGYVLTLWPSLGLFFPRPYATLSHKLFLSDFIPGILSSLWNFCVFGQRHIHTHYHTWHDSVSSLMSIQLWNMSKCEVCPN